MSDPGIALRYSVPSALAGNAQPQTSAAASLGGYVSTTVWAGGSMPLFADDNLTGTTVYRCLFAANAGSNYTLKGAAVYITGGQPDTSSVAIGADPVPVVLLNSTGAQAAVLASESAPAPSGVSFVSPAYGTSALVLGDIAPMHCRAFWVRRISTGTVPATDQTVTLRLSGTLTL